MSLRRLSFVVSALALIAIPTGLYAAANSAASESKPQDCCADPSAGCCDPISSCCEERVEKCQAVCEQAKAGGASCEEACAVACEVVCGVACDEPAPATCDDPCQDACAGSSAPAPSSCCGGK